MQPFEVVWDKARWKPVRERVAAYRYPPVPSGGESWDYGCDPAFLRRLCTYWVDGYDPEKAAAELNRYPQIRVQVEDLTLHAVHVVGEAQGRRPLLLAHGWPGSIYEFWGVIDRLAYPSRHGGSAADAFDLVIPSLPGYGFSDKPEKPIGARTTARLFDGLMRKLGYGSYLAQGGDWGAGIVAWMALDHADALRAIHLNYLLVQPDASPETEAERAWRAAADATQQKLGAYAHLQGTKPQSLAYAMVDNPVAQLAWLIERFHDWADLSGGSLEDVFGLDRLLTNAMTYLMNDAFVSATWFYAGGLAEAVRKIPNGRRIEVPTAFTAYPDRRMPAPPRSWVERGYNLTRWTQQPRGGHFAAMEVPEAFAADLQAWGRGLPTR